MVGAGSGGRCGWAGQGGFDIYFCVFWLLLPGFDFGEGTGRWAMSAPKFGIFLIFPYFLGS